jgi:hypothetical protein
LSEEEKVCRKRKGLILGESEKKRPLWMKPALTNTVNALSRFLRAWPYEPKRCKSQPSLIRTVGQLSWDLPFNVKHKGSSTSTVHCRSGTNTWRGHGFYLDAQSLYQKLHSIPVYPASINPACRVIDCSRSNRVRCLAACRGP